MARKLSNFIRRSINIEAKTITFQEMVVIDDKPVVGDYSLTFTMDKAHADNLAYAALHGFNQRIGDAAALTQGASMADKFTAMRKLAEHYESGSPSWDMGRVTGPRKSADEMLAELLANDPEKLAAIVAAAQEAAARKAANATG